MSSLKNAHKSGRKTYGERQQLSSRRHLGFLEKKKDYKKRAADYAKKRDAHTKWQKLILDKNPDEFYFGMISSQLDEKGRHIMRKTGDGSDKDAVLTREQLSMMRSQDISYVRQAISVENGHIEKLRANLHFVGGHSELEESLRNTHTYFVDDDAMDALITKIGGSTDESLPSNTKSLEVIPKNKCKLHSSHKGANQLPEERLISIEKAKRQSYKELSIRLQRLKQLKILADKMEVRQQLNNPRSGPKRCIKKETKESASVYKWKKPRKR